MLNSCGLGLGSGEENKYERDRQNERVEELGLKVRSGLG